MDWQRTIELLSPTFCRGAYQDTPEIRAPSIRGMVRWWFRSLNAPDNDASPGRSRAWPRVWEEEKDLFGGVAGDATASRLVFRVLEVQAQVGEFSTLPHKPTPGQRSPMQAFRPGGKFTLRVLPRACPRKPSEEQWRKVTQALETWLLLGSLGFRSNRASGAIWREGYNPNPSEFAHEVATHGCRWPLYLAGPDVGDGVEDLRRAATDTLSEPSWVFGSARGERLASPLKFKIVRIDGQPRLLVTAADERVIQAAKQALAGHLSKPDTWRRIQPEQSPTAQAPVRTL